MLESVCNQDFTSPCCKTYPALVLLSCVLLCSQTRDSSRPIFSCLFTQRIQVTVKKTELLVSPVDLAQTCWLSQSFGLTWTPVLRFSVFTICELQLFIYYIVFIVVADVQNFQIKNNNNFCIFISAVTFNFTDAPQIQNWVFEMSVNSTFLILFLLDFNEKLP